MNDQVTILVALAIFGVVFIAIIWGVVRIIDAVLQKTKLKQERQRLQRLEEKYGKIAELEKTADLVKEEGEKAQKNNTSLAGKRRQLEREISDLKRQLSIYVDDLDAVEIGILPASFELDDSQSYKDRVNSIKSQQKAMINNNKACLCKTEWAVDGSKKKGRTMTNQQIKMALRSFNNECDVAISKVKWSNYQKIVERIEKSFYAINRFNEKHTISITEDYFNLKIEELHNTYQYRLKKHQEQEEQREIRQQMREEERARREIEKAIKEAEKEEKAIQSALTKARAEMAAATAEQKHKYETQLKALEEKLTEAEARGERALSMAQQTKRGHVYVISNLGSFGEDVFKIGMTRRLEPLDRVKELGDASVPFPFDVHAMIFSEDAPGLEKELHRHFELASVNKVNNRKEFFELTLKEIRDYLDEKGIDARWTMTAEATEYRQSLVILEQQAKSAA